MTDIKMNNVIISTNKFIATLTYPVKNKVIQPISKKQTETIESIDAVITITPVIHAASENGKLAGLLHSVLICPQEAANTKNKQKQLQDFLAGCDEKVRTDLKASVDKADFSSLKGHVDHMIINLFDKDGSLLKSEKHPLQDVVTAFNNIKTRLLFWKKPDKRAAFLVPQAEPKIPKPRRKERCLKGEKEGGTCRYRPGTTPKVA